MFRRVGSARARKRSFIGICLLVDMYICNILTGKEFVKWREEKCACPRADPGEGLQLFQRLVEVLLQVLDVLDADRDAEHSRAHTVAIQLLLRHVDM